MSNTFKVVFSCVLIITGIGLSLARPNWNCDYEINSRYQERVDLINN